MMLMIINDYDDHDDFDGVDYCDFLYQTCPFEIPYFTLEVAGGKSKQHLPVKKSEEEKKMMKITNNYPEKSHHDKFLSWW